MARRIAEAEQAIEDQQFFVDTTAKIPPDADTTASSDHAPADGTTSTRASQSSFLGAEQGFEELEPLVLGPSRRQVDRAVVQLVVDARRKRALTRKSAQFVAETRAARRAGFEGADSIEPPRGLAGGVSFLEEGESGAEDEAAAQQQDQMLQQDQGQQQQAAAGQAGQMGEEQNASEQAAEQQTAAEQTGEQQTAAEQEQENAGTKLGILDGLTVDAHDAMNQSTVMSEEEVRSGNKGTFGPKCVPSPKKGKIILPRPRKYVGTSTGVSNSEFGIR